LNNPQTYDEKVCWLNLYWRHPLKTRCGDKYTLRSYVEEQGLGHLLPELLGVYDSVDEIDFGALPERFVLKCTHGSKCNIICKDRRRLDVQAAKRALRRWMMTDYSKFYGELHYAGMKPRIICECFLDDSSGGLPWDYKVHCFGGKAYCTEVCSDRGLDGHHAKYDIYGLQWQPLPDFNEPGLHSNRVIQRPEAYEEMIAAAEKLSQPFPYVRVDFYNIGRRAVLGEMTFTPAGGIDTDLSEHAQRVLGDLIKLPEKRLQ
jgi:hypothetical protein